MCAASGTLAHSIRGLRLRYRTARLGERFAHALDQLVRGERLAEVTRDSRFAGARLGHLFRVSRMITVGMPSPDATNV
jgi:hypothetical protein